MNPALRRELRRKSFHLLTLVYLAAYFRVGRPDVLVWAGGWTLCVGWVEFVRLRRPAWNRVLLGPFQGILREDEHRRLSGLFYTSAGAFLAMLLFGPVPAAVTAALLCLTFGDAAAAIGGRLWGRRKWLGSEKSIEGTACCAAVSLAALLAAGLPWPSAAFGAAAAAAIELADLPGDDNLWIPLGAGALVWLTSI